MISTDIILASSSPRREALLRDLGFSFRVVKPLFDESQAGDFKSIEEVGELTLHLSLEKGMSVAANYEDNFVLAADTLVYSDHVLMGKPENRETALKFLNQLSGKVHQVVSGFTWIFLSKGLIHSQYSVTHVFVNRLSQKEINEYLDLDDVLDAAGAYKIQGLFSRYISRIEGSYHNVVGLPVDLVYESFCQLNGQK